MKGEREDLHRKGPQKSGLNEVGKDNPPAHHPGQSAVDESINQDLREQSTRGINGRVILKVIFMIALKYLYILSNTFKCLFHVLLWNVQLHMFAVNLKW